MESVVTSPPPSWHGIPTRGLGVVSPDSDQALVIIPSPTMHTDRQHGLNEYDTLQRYSTEQIHLPALVVVIADYLERAI